MKKIIFQTQDHWTGFITRVALGLLMLPHGLQKTFGWFGGYGYSASMQYFVESMQLPWLLSFLVIMTEFVGALCLVFGLATRFWSIAMIILMIGTIVTVHWEYGFFMNWSGTAKGEGMEYQLAMIALSFVSLINGAGKYSIDQLLTLAPARVRTSL